VTNSAAERSAMERRWRGCSVMYLLLEGTWEIICAE
jgi:hypothetical protein